MRGTGALPFGVGGSVEGLLAEGLDALAARVGVEAVFYGAFDEGCAVGSGGESDYEEGGEGVDGVV